MHISVKVALKPNKEQEQLFWKWANSTRYVYNYALDLKTKAYKDQNINLSWNDITKVINQIKYTDDYIWLSEVPSETLKYAVKDLDSAFQRFFNGAGYPKFKKKNKTTPSFYTRYDKLYSIDNRHIKICGCKTPLKTYEEVLIPNKPLNPRIKYDGKYWYLTYGVEILPENRDVPLIRKKLQTYSEIHNKEISEPLGIDLGILKTAVCSNGKIYENINKTNKEIIRLEKKKKRLQQQVSRKYECNKQGNKFIKTNNIRKHEQQIKLVQRRINNIRNNYINNMTLEIVKTKPSIIVMEDLAVSNMMKNKYLAKSIQEQKWYDIKRIIKYKAKLYGVPEKEVSRFYKSSKTCSCCGFINNNLTLQNRAFKCPNCGNVIDRDLNAAINLSKQ